MTPTYPNIFTMNLNESKDYGHRICSNRLGGGARSSNNKSEGVKPAVFLQLQNKTLTKK